MARDHARIHVTIWRDRDFRALPADAQRLYFLLTSQPNLSYCGVLDWWPSRLAQLAADTDEQAIYSAAKSLIDGRFIVLDVETSELLVRTYIKHDRVMNRANMGKAVATALSKVTSLDLVDAIHVELARLMHDEPGLAGFVGLREASALDYSAVLMKCQAIA